jgi:phenylalanyl-tRNA synthetase beta chain
MKISINWLRELCPTDLSNDAIAQRLTAVGFEVEGREERGLPGQDPKEGMPAGVVAARVVTRSPIEGSDHLSLCEVDDGTQIWKVVCGAQNYAAGDVVPLARVGAELPGGMKIRAAKLRGTESNGMLCSAKELGLGDDHSGLLHLSHETKLGTPVEKLLGLPDTVLEINVTPNRPDALSHVGISRELAASLKTSGLWASDFGLWGNAATPAFGALEQQGSDPALAVHQKAKVSIESTRCARYLGRVIEGVKIAPSPLALQERLRGAGVRAINNVVDATNLALLELGHPLHAFDLDKVSGAQIVVRLAAEGEKMTTLDGKERALTSDDLLICDGAGPVALAGIMGGQSSEVSDGTSRILLESAVFEGAGTRRTGKRQGLKSEASARFEKGTDEETARRAIDRCAELIAQLAGGQIIAGVIDVWPSPHREAAQIWVRPAQVSRSLGSQIHPDEVESRLGSLGLKAIQGDAEKRLWQVPGFRRDLTREIDCTEEIARQRGLDSIPIVPHLAGVGTTQRRSAAEIATAAVRQSLAARGFDEALNYSFVSERDLDALYPLPVGLEKAPVMIQVARPIRVQNPLTTEQGAMRTSMLPGLLRNLGHNLARGTSDVRLYELGRVYLGTLDPRHSSGPLAWPVAEPRRLGIAMVGRGAPAFWATPKAGELDSAGAFYAMKGAVEELCAALRIPSVSFVNIHAGQNRPHNALEISTQALHPAYSAVLHLSAIAEGPHAGKAAGAFGMLHPLVAKAFDLPANVMVAELDWELLIEQAQTVPQSKGLPRFPSVTRDLAFVVAANVPASALRAEIRSADDKGLLEAVEPFDVYRGAPVPAEKKSVAWSLTLRAADRTLTDAEADALIQAVVARLRERVGAEIRA